MMKDFADRELREWNQGSTWVQFSCRCCCCWLVGQVVLGLVLVHTQPCGACNVPSGNCKSRTAAARTTTTTRARKVEGNTHMPQLKWKSSIDPLRTYEYPACLPYPMRSSHTAHSLLLSPCLMVIFMIIIIIGFGKNCICRSCVPLRCLCSETCKVKSAQRRRKNRNIM